MRLKKILVLLAFGVSVHGTAFAGKHESWRKSSLGIVETKITCLLAASDNSFVLAGTNKALYRKAPADQSFVQVLAAHTPYKNINQIYHNPKVASLIYAATDAGLFVSEDQGVTWTNIFERQNILERKCLAVATDGDTVYVGTADGFFWRVNGESAWHKASGALGQKPIYFIQGDAQYLYVANSHEVYRFTKVGEEQKKVFTLPAMVVSEEVLNEDGEILSKPQIKALALSPQLDKVYLAASGDIFLSFDHGDNWEHFPTEGMAANYIKKLLITYDRDDRENIYAATDQGVFYYSQGRWQTQVRGFQTNRVNDIVQAESGHLYAATSSGLFEQILSAGVLRQQAYTLGEYNDVMQMFASEPTIKEVHRMAINYANLNPEEIKRWHKEARAKAFFPKFSVGLNRSGTELYHWDTGTNPDTLVRGRDYMDWSTSLSWDFGELVWSSDHTSIDSRSKLMSELRQDILDQITRLYFERRKIQVELLTKTDLEKSVVLDKQMRVDELTALLDGFTGGKFSNHD